MAALLLAAKVERFCNLYGIPKPSLIAAAWAMADDHFGRWARSRFLVYVKRMRCHRSPAPRCSLCCARIEGPYSRMSVGQCRKATDAWLYRQRFHTKKFVSLCRAMAEADRLLLCSDTCREQWATSKYRQDIKERIEWRNLRRAQALRKACRRLLTGRVAQPAQPSQPKGC